MIFGEKELKESKLTTYSSKVSSSILKEEYKCPKQHILKEIDQPSNPLGRNRCNICR